MKKLLPVTIAFAAVALVAGTVYAAAYYGEEYTFGGVGPATSGYAPGAYVRSLVFHVESSAQMDLLRINGVSYTSTCRQIPPYNAYHCITPLLAAGPAYIEIATGSYWWVEVTEYYTRWMQFLPELHAIQHSTPLP